MKKNTLILVGVAAAILFIAMRKKKGGKVSVEDAQPITEEEYGQGATASDAGGSTAPSLSRQVETLSTGRKPLSSTKKIYSGGRIRLVQPVKKVVRKSPVKKVAKKRIGFPALY